MSKFEKAVARLLSGESDASFSFEVLRTILLRFGFQERTRGSHHIFSREGVEELVTLQPGTSGGEAKPYQVAQVRRVIQKYTSGGHDAGE